MSATDGRQRIRSVVPRWRSFLNTPSVEVVTEARYPKHPRITSAAFNDLISQWRRDGRPADAVDIMDAGIAAGSRQLAVEGAKKVIALGGQMQERVREQADGILFSRPRHISVASAPFDEQVAEEIWKKISRLKASLLESPRNALSHVEIARLYSRLAQFDKATYHIKLAIALYPNDRFILRVATRYFTMLGESNQALNVLWNSESIRYDPWVMSAELSAAMLARRGTKFAHRAAKGLRGSSLIDRGHSELAAGWISKQRAEGLAVKQTLASVSRILRDPTENALAQSVWLTDNLGRKFGETFPNARFGSDAHEAKALALSDAGDFEAAEAATRAWFLDQPFQARASIELANLNFVYLRRYADALAAAEAGLLIHSEEWLLINLASISSARAGVFEKTRKYLKIFEKMASDGKRKSYLAAARGMYDFERGNLKDGVKNYMEAVQIAKRENMGELIITAYIYLVEMSFKHRIFPIEDYEILKKSFDSAVKKLSVPNRESFERLWKSREVVISDVINSPNYQNDFASILESKDIIKELLEE